MKDHIEQFIAALNFAWGELFDFPLQMIFKGQKKLDQNNEFTLAAFPFLGFLLGLIVAFSSFLMAVIFNHQAGGLFFAVIGWLVLCFKDSGRGDVWFGKYCCSLLQKHSDSTLSVTVLTVFPVLLKFLLLLFIGIAGGFFYLPVLLGAAFAVQAALASCEDCPVAFIPYGSEGEKYFKIAMVVLALIGFAGCSMATLGATVAAILIYFHFRKRMCDSGFTAGAISNAGYFAEWILLAVGLLLV